MIMCVLLCYPVSFHMLQLLSTGRPISSLFLLCVHVEKIPVITYLFHKRTVIYI